VVDYPEQVTVCEGVRTGAAPLLDAPCVIGKPARGPGGDLPATIIGDECHIRPFTTIYAGVTIGDRFQTGQGASIREDNVIGDDVSVGTNAVLEPGNRIGNNVRIHTGCFLESVTVGDGVFIAPNVVFADDPHPPCPRYLECKGGPVVEAGAKIGANSTILPGVRIGERALIGAGSVVTADVPSGAVVAGNPARIVKSVEDLECEPGFFERPYEWERSSE